MVHEAVTPNLDGSLTVERYRTKETCLTVSDLQPSSGHGFSVQSVTVSGLSPPSAKILYFTTPSVPEAPPMVELLKVRRLAGLLAAGCH